MGAAACLATSQVGGGGGGSPLPPGGGGRPFLPESGPIAIRGPHWWANGRPWYWRGATMFLLLERQMNGEDITPELDWLESIGVNVARVFVAGVPWPGHNWLYDRGDWTAQLYRMAKKLTDRGTRLEATVCTDKADDPRWRDILQSVCDTLDPIRDMVFVEDINEPWVQGHGLAYARIERHGILSAYGLQPEPMGETGYVRHLDYGTVHTPRDLDHFPRNSKDLEELQNNNGCPWVSDEPLGIAEKDKEGAGARTTNTMAVAGHFAIASLFGGGATIHSQCGLEGRRPSAQEPITESLARTISDIWQFIPAEIPLGDYTRGGMGNFPLDWREADQPSTLSSQHAYASILGDVSYAVIPMPRDDYEVKAAPGWKIEKELLHGIVKLVRV